MTTLGIGTESQAHEKKELPAWTKTIAQGSLFGGGLAGVTGVVFSIVGLVRSNPDKGFQLLEKWGPWFILATVAVLAAYGIANRVLDVCSLLGNRFGDSMDRIADEQEKLSEAARAQSDAMKRSADRDDRDTERLSTLIEYSARHSRQALEAVTGMTSTMSALHDKLDKVLEKGS